jgi:D-2-hydroxyacid dehydrogenase (NADP+)
MQSSEGMTLGILNRVLYQGELEREVDKLRRVYPSVHFVLGHYEEPHALRTARSGSAVPDTFRAQAPALDEAQLALFAQADALIALDLPFNVRSIAPKLKWVQSIGAGTNQLQSSGLKAAGIRLTSNGGANAVSVAEFVVARILEVMKRLRAINAAQNERAWLPLNGTQLSGRTVGLIGLGSINTRVAFLMKAFGVHVLAVRRSSKASPYVDRVYRPDEIDQMLGLSDIVVAAVPDTQETARMMNAARIAALRQSAIFCNVGRGTLVDERALVAALQAGRLAAAVLDVMSVEPLPTDHTLWATPNLYLSPHCATDPSGMFHSFYRLVEDNIGRFLQGAPLLSEVDLEA